MSLNFEPSVLSQHTHRTRNGSENSPLTTWEFSTGSSLTKPIFSLQPSIEPNAKLRHRSRPVSKTAKSNLLSYVRSIDVPGVQATDLGADDVDVPCLCGHGYGSHEPEEVDVEVPLEDERFVPHDGGHCKHCDCEGFIQDEDLQPLRVEPAEHHELMLGKLGEIERGEINRLMLLFPPGSAKSTYASVVFPTYFLGKEEKRSIICASYGSTLPKKFGRRCRSVVRALEFESIFDVKLSTESKAADHWLLSNESEYMGAGILAGITGNRAHGLIIDDPVKGREAADSDVIRDKTWEAYTSDLRTRLVPRGWIVLIQTRWHEDDMAGRILPDKYAGESGKITAKDGEEWDVLCVQAQAERDDDPLGRQAGEYFWPGWFGPDHFEQEKVSQGPRNWSALFQQRPAPEGGSLFKREWIQWYDRSQLPEHLAFYGSSDLAVTDDEDPGSKDAAYTVHMIAGMDAKLNIYIVDLWRQKAHSGIWTDAMIQMHRQWNVLSWLAAKQQIEKSVLPLLKRRLEEEGSSLTFDLLAEDTNKVARSASIRARLWQGKVFLPLDRPWAVELADELVAFPAGRYSDQVDAIARFGLKLDSLYGKQVPVAPRVIGFNTPEYIKMVVKQMATNESNGSNGQGNKWE